MWEWPSTRPGISVVYGSSTAMAPDASRLARGPAASTRSPLTRTAQPSCMVSPSKTRAGFRSVTAPGSRAGGCGSATEARMTSNRMRRRASIRQLYASFGGAGDFACEYLLTLRLAVRQVESRLGAGTDAEAPPCFPTPLIKPDVPISGIRLSDWLRRRLTNRPHRADHGDGTPLTPRRSASSKTDGCLAIAPCAAVSGNAAHAPRRVHRAPRRPSLGSPIRNTLSSPSASDSADRALLPRALHCRASDALPLSA